MADWDEPHIPGWTERTSSEDFNGEIARLRSRVAELEKVLKEISVQRLYDEMGGGEQERASFEDGYDECVKRARAALATKEPKPCPECDGTGYQDKGGARVAIQRVPCSKGCRHD